MLVTDGSGASASTQLTRPDSSARQSDADAAELDDVVGIDIEADGTPRVGVGADDELGDRGHCSRPSCQVKKVSTSANSSARLLAGLPTPWPARPS